MMRFGILFIFFPTRKALTEIIIGIISYILETTIKWAFPAPMMPVADHRRIISTISKTVVKHDQQEGRSKMTTNTRVISALLEIMSNEEISTSLNRPEHSLSPSLKTTNNP